MATAADLIKSSLRAAGIIATGETPSSAEETDALEVLNDILEEWSNDGFTVYERTIENLTLQASTGSYTIGSGATFNTVRPQLILAAKFKQSGQNHEFDLRIYNDEEWAQITDKTLESGIVEGIYYNRTVPYGTIYVWPKPDAADTLILHSLKPLTALATSTSLSYPPGYKKALKYALACELSPEYGRPVDPKLEQIARDAKVALQRTNTEPVLMRSDAFGLNECVSYDIFTGE